MRCERCKRAEATIHLTEIIKDQKSEVHLCESCARDIGLNAKLSGFSLSVPEMLSFLDISEIDETAPGVVCTTCGQSYLDYKKEGKLGCPDCYRHMEEPLRQVISAYHGSLQHVGKYPAWRDVPPTAVPQREPRKTREAADRMREPTLEQLKEMLEAAILEERFEDAAVLRDRIRQWKTV